MFSVRSCFRASLLLMMFATFHFKENENDNLAVQVYVALDGVLRFIYENIDDMNVDGMFGVVLAEAHLRSIPVSNGKNNFEYLIDLATYIVKQFKTRHRNASSRNEIFMRNLLIARFWMRDIEFGSGSIRNRSYVDYVTCPQYFQSLANMHFSEELSDECLLSVIEKSLAGEHVCALDQACAEFLSNNAFLPGYGVTHKLLLLQTVRAFKCKWDRAWMYKKTVDFCSRIFHEAKKIQHCGFITDLDDLFLEQILLCGYEGFEEFMSRAWIEHVLRIQSSYGCFGTFTSTSMFEKREANLIKYNCIDHTSGLGAAVLSLFLRYLTVSGKGGTFIIIERYEDNFLSTERT